MIDLTPLDVRKKRGDFRRQLRGYDPDEVNQFLDLVGERLEELVKENLTLRERSERLQSQVSSQEGREKAVQDALVTAQQLRDDIRGQAQREAEDLRSRAEREAEELRARAEQELRLARREAEAEARRVLEAAERKLEERQRTVEELERTRLRFLKAFRQLLQRELDVVEVEEGRTPLEDVAVDLDLGGGRAGRFHEGPPAGEDDEAPFAPDAPVHDLARSALEGGEEELPPADEGFEGDFGDGEDEEPAESFDGPEEAEDDRPWKGQGPSGPSRAFERGSGGGDEPELWLSSILDDAETDQAEGDGDGEPRE